MAKEYLMKTEVPIKSPFVCLFQFEEFNETVVKEHTTHL